MGRRIIGGERASVLLGVAFLGFVAVACGRSRSPSGGGEATGGSGAAAGRGGAGAGGSSKGGQGGSSGASAEGGTGGPLGEAGAGGMQEACVPAEAPLMPLRVLTRFQYDNVIRDVFGDDSRRAQNISFEPPAQDLGVDGFATVAWVTDLHRLAHDFALSSTQSPEVLSATLGCDAAEEGEGACETRLFERLLPRLFRRPLDAEDRDELEAVFADGRSQGGDFASGVRMVLEVALQSPELLYRPEVGEPLDVPSSDPRSGWGRPTPFEMASRLSFTLWGSAPDEALLEEAASGGLRTQEQVRAAAERLLEDERATAVLNHGNRRLLGLALPFFSAANFPNDPGLTFELSSLMESQLDAFLDDVAVSGPRGFERLLTAPYTYVNEELAAFYGIPDVSGSELRKVTLASPPHAGVLTHGAFLAAHSNEQRSSPTRRGLAVLGAFGCEEALKPPGTLPVDPLPSSEPLTTRELVQRDLDAGGPACVTCHERFDPFGFALEHFDQAGRYRDTEAGKPIDAAADVLVAGEKHAVDGAAELGRLLAESPEVRACYVRNWAAYVYATTNDAPLDECSRQELEDAFERSNGDLRALLLELTQTDAFLYRRLEEP